MQECSVNEAPRHNGKLYIETVGCQMNMLDSELVVGALRKNGYELTSDIRQADTLLFNTCSVREHAEHKPYRCRDHADDTLPRVPSHHFRILDCRSSVHSHAIHPQFISTAPARNRTRASPSEV